MTHFPGITDLYYLYYTLFHTLHASLFLFSQLTGNVMCNSVVIGKFGKVFGNITSESITMGPQVRTYILMVRTFILMYEHIY